MATLRWEDPIHYYDYTPDTVQRHHGREQKRHPYQAARDPPRFFGRRIKRKAEDHHDQQREEQH